MKPQLFALLTALAWGIGGYFEKKGLHLGTSLSTDGDHDSDIGRIGHPCFRKLSALEKRSTSRNQVNPLPDGGGRGCCWSRWDALFLCGDQERSVKQSHADCFYGTSVWSFDGGFFWR